MKRIVTYLKSLISSETALEIKYGIECVDYFVLRLACHSKIIAIFYTLLLGRFQREWMSVIHGRYQHLKQSRKTSNTGNIFLLRRNIHRLEKGLIMRPPKPVFGLDYIDETLHNFELVLRSKNCLDETLSWAHDVLNKYFLAAEHSEKIAPRRLYFAKILSIHSRLFTPLCQKGASLEKIPYERGDTILSTINIEDLEILYRQRRSVRWYTNEPIEEHLIERAASLASLAPSACNRLAYEFMYIANSEFASLISSIPMGTTGFYQNIKNVVIVVGDLSAYMEERDRHLIYIDGGLAAMQFMLALEALGLSSCPINWPDIEKLEQRMAKELGLPPYKRPVMLISIGYADAKGKIPYSEKKNILTKVHEKSNRN